MSKFNKNNLMKFINKKDEELDDYVPAYQESEDTNWSKKLDAMDEPYISETPINQENVSVEPTVTEDLVINKPEVMVEEVSESNISKDMSLTGNICAQGNLSIFGSINGDVECYHNLTLTGNVVGNIKASYITLTNATVKGNIECEYICKVLENTSIEGYINANAIIVNGTINGNINVQEKIILEKNAVVTGDCKSSKISIEEGAIVKGNIQTSNN